MTRPFSIATGIVALAILIGITAIRYWRDEGRGRLPFRGWVGLGVILGAEVLLFFGFQPITIFFTATAWTGYLFLADGIVEALTGSSRMRRDPKGFVALAFWSVPLWLIFEAYNLRLQNWTYVGLPPELGLRLFGYVWAFATIWPAIFLTRDLVLALRWLPDRRQPGLKFSTRTQWWLVALGLLMILVPVLVPAGMGQYLFGSVWLGFIFLLDPINRRVGQGSLLSKLEQGKTSEIYALLIAGGSCGLLWEFWNFWATAKWHYTFPLAQDFKIFEMPLPGYIGFGPFALECFVMYEAVRAAGKYLQRRIEPPTSQPLKESLTGVEEIS